MKRIPFLPVVLALAAMVTAFSCTPLQEVDGGYYERVSTAPSRIYVDDPYRGTVILERDPYTGRYYDVNAYGSRYGYGSDPYYGRGYGRNYPRQNTRVYRAPRQSAPQAPTREQLKQREENRKEARNKVLGN